MKAYKFKIFSVLFAALIVCSNAWAWKMEADSVTLIATTSTSDFQSVTFDQNYDQVPLVFVLGTADAETAAVRIKDVSLTGFKALVVEPDDDNAQDNDDGQHDAMTLHYLAIEPGDHFMPDGTQISATQVGVSTLGHKSFFINQNTGFVTYLYDEDYIFTSAPTIIGQIQDMTGETATPPSTTSQPWMTEVFNSAGTTSVSVALEHSEVNNSFSSASDVPVGILVVDGNATGAFDDASGTTINWETLNTSLAAASVTVSPAFSRTCTSVDLTSAFSSAPLVVGSKVSRNSTDGGWLARCAAGPGNGLTEINLAIEEDASGDAERTPAAESISIMAFSESFIVDFGSGGNSFNRLRYEHPGSGTYCDWIPVSLRAESQAGRLLSGYNKTVQVNTQSEGTWRIASGNGTLVDSGGHGTAQYTFSASDNGRVGLELLYAGSESQLRLKARQIDDATVDDDNTTAPLFLAPANLIVTDVPFASSTARTFSETKKAGEPFEVYLSVYGNLDSTACGVSTGLNDIIPVTVTAASIDPSASITTMEYERDGSFWPLSSSRIDTQFVNGEGIIRLRYRDVGKVQIGFEAPVTDGTGTTVRLLGSTMPFVVQPYDIEVSEVFFRDRTRRQNVFPSFWSTPASEVILSAGESSAFLAAGKPFKVVLKPVNMQGDFTANYGQESIPQSFELESILLSPAMGRNGANNDGTMHEGDGFEKFFDNFTNTDVRYDEVGYIRLKPHALGKNYLGGGDIDATPSAPVGRFFPSYFSVEMQTAPQLRTACTNAASAPPAWADTDGFEDALEAATEGFSYLRQPIEFETAPVILVSPTSDNGHRIQNYKNYSAQNDLNYMKLPAELEYDDNEANNKRPLFDVYKERRDIGFLPKAHVEADDSIRLYRSAVNTNGTIEYTLDVPWLKVVNDDNEAISEFEADVILKVTLADSDGAALVDGDTLIIGSSLLEAAEPGSGMAFSNGKNFILGRLVVSSAMGEAGHPIEMPVRIEVFDGFQYATNANDSCTPISIIQREDIQFYNIKITPDDMSVLQNATMTIKDRFEEGRSSLTISLDAEDGQTSGSFDVLVPIDNAQYLQFDWPNDGDYDGQFDDSPSATVTIGGGKDDGYDYWEELY